MSGHGTLACSSASPHCRSQRIVSDRKLAVMLWPLRSTPQTFVETSNPSVQKATSPEVLTAERIAYSSA